MVPVAARIYELKVILLTGQPGVGKTTMVNMIHEHYSQQRAKVEGITTREVRECGGRIGFKITDLSNGREGWLARKDSGTGPRIGSYRVISEDLEKIGVIALEHAVEGPAELVIVDEIGPMEMTSHPFRSVISRVLGGSKATIATVKFGSHYSEVEHIRDKSLQLEITKDNRKEVYRRILQQIDDWTRPGA